jgi:hypothetical protein
MNTIIRMLSLTLIFSAVSTFAAELKSDDLNFTITVPDAWTVKSQDQTGFYVKSQDGNKDMNLAVIRATFAKLDSSYIAQYEQVLKQTRHLQLVSSRIFTNDGVQVYENIQRIGEGSAASVKVERQILADGRFYSLTAVRFGGDATQDPEIQAALTSFHFLHAPKPPSSFGFGGLGLLGVVAILGVIGIGVFLAVRSRQT